MDWQSVDLVTRQTELSNPLEKAPFYVLMETAGSNGIHDEEVSHLYVYTLCICTYWMLQKLNEFLEVAFNENLILDGLVATDLTKVYVVVIACIK